MWDCSYSATCLVSTQVSIHSWLVSTTHSVPSLCTLCQTVLIVSTDRKYRFGCALHGTYQASLTVQYKFQHIFKLSSIIHVSLCTNVGIPTLTNMIPTYT